MNRILLALLAVVCLSGCASTGQAVFETMEDSGEIPQLESTCRVFAELPAEDCGESAASVTYALETLRSDSLGSLLQELTGRTPDTLTVVKSTQAGLPRYDLTWVTAGEAEDMIWQAAILDDGITYHVLTAGVPCPISEQARQEISAVFHTLTAKPGL